ncbi:MAG: hypothetical protein K2P59_08525, partial [Acetatifactor sp.]|nr:hypothetical protein [Acetatifactor sp.]
MKKKFFKRAMALAMAAAMTVSLAACGGDDGQQMGNTGSSSDGGGQAASSGVASDGGSQAETPQIEETTLTIRVMNEFRNLDKVLERYEEMTADDPIMSNIHLDFAWVAGGDYKDKLTTAMIGQEDFDLMFCGGWHGLSAFIPVSYTH